MKIAIVGTGVSGLVCAHLLHRYHDVHVFEAEDRIGGHANTVEVPTANGPAAVDTGFIVYNETTYPGFTRLLSALDVETLPSDMSFGFSSERDDLEWASSSLDTLFAQRRNLLRPRFYGLLREILRFNREARAVREADDKLSLGDYLCGAGHSPEFVEGYVVPLGAAIWSTTPREFLRFPAASFIRFFDNHGLLERPSPVQWRTIRGGSRRYVEALAAPFADRIRLGTPVRAILRDPGVAVLTEAAGPEAFDRVVLAVHSDQALQLLADPSPAEVHVLSRIRYQENEAVLHTDARLMPRARRAWASWNYRVPREGRDRVLVTYHMNRLQQLTGAPDLFVTLNPDGRVDPRHVVQRIVYHHPVFDAAAITAQQHHHRIDGLRATHFCGAYWGHGFHEDGLQSALRVCRRLAPERSSLAAA